MPGNFLFQRRPGYEARAEARRILAVSLQTVPHLFSLLCQLLGDTRYTAGVVEGENAGGASQP